MLMGPDPKWFSLIQTCLQRERSNPAARFFQLATLNNKGEPAVRTVVFRGWFKSAPGESEQHQPSLAMKIITDTRTEKLQALRKYPFAEICWYFVETRKQLRLTSRNIQIVEADEMDPSLAEARKDQWIALSDNARLQFRYPSPGAERPTAVDGEDPFKPENPSATHPEDTFALLIVEPYKVDVLDLRANERCLYSLDEDYSWTETFLNP